MTDEHRAKHAAPQPVSTRLEAKEARLRTDQREHLGHTARRLERDRPTGHGRRITENTLIRVAVDALLEVADNLQGHDELALLNHARHQLRRP